jgi:hypothetical protein
MIGGTVTAGRALFGNQSLNMAEILDLPAIN